MILTIAKSSLLRLLQTAAAPVDPDAAQPILTKILLRTTREWLTATGTDLGVTVHARADARVSAEGAVCVGREVIERVAALPDGDVTVKASEGHLHLTAGSRKFKVETLPVDDYPAMPAAPTGGAEVDGKAFAALLARGSHSMADKDRPACMVGELAFAKGAATVWSTNGHSMVVASASFAGNDSGPLTLPARSVKLLTKFAAACPTLTVAHDGRAVHVSGPDASMTCVMASEHLPDRAPLMRVFADATPAAVVKLDRTPLADAVQAISAADKDGVLIVTLRASKIVVSARDGSAEDIVGCSGKGTATLEVAGHLLAAALEGADDDDVTVSLPNSHTEPVIVRSGDGGSYMCVVMCLMPKAGPR